VSSGNHSPVWWNDFSPADNSLPVIFCLPPYPFCAAVSKTRTDGRRMSGSILPLSRKGRTGLSGTSRVMSGRMLIIPSSLGGTKFLRSAKISSVEVRWEMGRDRMGHRLVPKQRIQYTKGPGMSRKKRGIYPDDQGTPPSLSTRPISLPHASTQKSEEVSPVSTFSPSSFTLRFHPSRDARRPLHGIGFREEDVSGKVSLCIL
jgi:hypothetical protein